MSEAEMLALPPEGSPVRAVLRAGLVYVKNLNPSPREENLHEAVGGHWDVMGPLQFEFLKSRGLKPHHTLLDIGCGSLRAGRFLIPYLDAQKYLGFDIDEPLVRQGLAAELAKEVIDEKQPAFLFNDRLDFSGFQRAPDFAIAQSVFTHLVPKQIVACLDSLKALTRSCVLYATFNESSLPLPNGIFPPNTQRTFYYSQSQLRSLGDRAGWDMRYIGNWGHPRSQKMAEFVIAT